MARIDMQRKCPVCREKVYGLRPTKRYCGESCRSKHHYRARRQLVLRLRQENLGEYHQLVTRNLYLNEGLIGPDYNRVEINMNLLKMHKFQFGICFTEHMEDGIKKFQVCNYQYWQNGDNVVIERLGTAPDYRPSVAERWLEEFPDFSGQRKLDGLRMEKYKKFLLRMGQVWRE